MKNAAKTSPVTQKRHNANGRKGTSTLQQKINSKIQEHEKFGTQDEKEGYIIDFISGHSVRATPEETEAVPEELSTVTAPLPVEDLIPPNAPEVAIGNT